MIFDIAIIGAGIAGASLAAELGDCARVLLIEMEDAPGYHTTGRSAAFWSETYGGPDITPLTTASGPWLDAHGYLTHHGGVHIGRAEDRAAMDDFARSYAGSGVVLVPVDPHAFLPQIKAEWVLGLQEAGCADIDVGGLHGYYLSQARKTGATIACRAELDMATYQHGKWVLRTRAGEYQAGVLVNAAGAWADDVAYKCGVSGLNISPLRRTMVQLRMAGPLPAAMPFVIDINGGFYFKPEGADRLWLSPHDETPSPACDAAPEELDIAIAISRFEEVVDWKIAAVERKWAGLRSFAPDRLPVYGFDNDEMNFFWFAGQGGFGIQTAPAAAKLGAALLLGQPADASLAAIDAARYSPARFT